MNDPGIQVEGLYLEIIFGLINKINQFFNLVFIDPCPDVILVRAEVHAPVMDIAVAVLYKFFGIDVVQEGIDAKDEIIFQGIDRHPEIQLFHSFML